MKKVFFIFFLLNFINSYDPKFPLLQDDFKSDVEYIFEKGQNFSQIFDVNFLLLRMKTLLENTFTFSKKMKSI